MILYFYDTYFSAKEEIVHAKIPHTFDFNDEYMRIYQSELLLNDYKQDFKTLKKALGFLELSVPTMYKQYADLCDEGGIKFCAYNIDKDFSDCVDSFIIVDITKVKPKKRERYFNL